MSSGKLKKNIISLDLEMNQPSGKIIQVGACVGSIETGQILEKKMVFVKIDENLSDFIIGLTGISQGQVDNGVGLGDAYLELVKLHRDYNCFANPLTWGGGDSAYLLNKLKLEGISSDSFIFGRRWIDVKTIYQTWRMSNGYSIQGGLKSALSKMGLNSVGRHHDALVDSINTFRLYYKLMLLYRKKTNN